MLSGGREGQVSALGRLYGACLFAWLLLQMKWISLGGGGGGQADRKKMPSAAAAAAAGTLLPIGSAPEAKKEWGMCLKIEPIICIN